MRMDGATGQMTSAAAQGSAERLFAGGGETGARLAAIDWANTTLGPVESWPQTLRTSVRICLTSRHAIILWWGPDLIVFHNDAYAPTLGIKRPWAAGSPGREVWSEIWPTIGPMLEGVLQSGEPTWSDDQLLFLERSGYAEETYHTFSYSPIEDDSGEVMGVFTAVTETTQRVLAERRTRVARELASAVVDVRSGEDACARAADVLAHAVADAPFALLYLLDHSGQVARLSGASGLPSGHPLAPAVIDLTADASDAIWPLARVARSNQREQIHGVTPLLGATRIRSVEPPLELAPHTALALPITEPGQATPSAILVAGVSQLCPLNDDYVAFFERLVSHMAAGLASAHAYEQERRRAEALAELDRAKTAFFSNVSHEFRTPLTLMLGPLEDLLAGDAAGVAEMALPPDVRTHIRVIHRNGLRLLKLVNSLLDFARIEAGRVQAVYEPTDLASYTAELASSFRSLVEKAGMRLIVDCPPLDELAEPVYVDREMWEKIVLNLLSNAFKFTLKGSITVALRAVDEGHAVELLVRDTGVGVPADELPRLFERFHRVEGMQARTHEGSGIGLALIQELTHLHSGAIRAESVAGAGATFIVRLPVGAAHLPEDRLRASRQLASTALSAAIYVEEAGRWLPTEAPERAGESADSGALLSLESASPSTPRATSPTAPMARIVVADDNVDMREYLTRLLSERYRVEAVANGRQALNAVRRERPDLVLSDVMMPELDGFGLLRELRADPSTANLPVMLLSARAGEEATVEGLAAGADDYLVKPFSAREALGRVAARLEIARVRAEAEALALTEATRRMDEFLGVASHELRTPLTSMTANVQMAARQLHSLTLVASAEELSGLPGLNGHSETTTAIPTSAAPATNTMRARLERAERLLTRTDRQMLRLDRLVGDLLDVSRIQAGKLELRLEPCELTTIVRDAVVEQRAAWPHRSVTLDLPRRNAAPIIADADRIGQVVTNLLTNALKYAPVDQAIAVRVRMQAAPAGGAQRERVRVEVRDHGPGLSAEQRAHLFERFYRAPGIEQQSGSGVGLGLGLYICKTIVERHGGAIGLISEQGQGSVFWFSLPLASDNDDDAPATSGHAGG